MTLHRGKKIAEECGMAHINGLAVMAALNAAERSIGGRVIGGLHTASATSGPSLPEDFIHTTPLYIYLLKDLLIFIIF